MKQFYIPQYVKDILSRSQFAVDSGRFMDDDDPGYTILVHKRTARTMVYTLQAECERLEKWARMMWPDLDWENLPVSNSVFYKNILPGEKSTVLVSEGAAVWGRPRSWEDRPGGKPAAGRASPPPARPAGPPPGSGPGKSGPYTAAPAPGAPGPGCS